MGSPIGGIIITQGKSPLEDIVAKETIQYYDCVEIAIDATHTYYLTQAPYNLQFTALEGPGYGNNFIAAGGLLQMTEFVDNANFSIEQLEIQLAGIVELPTGETVLKTIQDLDYIDKPVTIYRAFMENNKVSWSIVLYKGYISGVTAGLSERGDSTTASITTASHWTDFDRVSTRYTNDNSQQSIHPGDEGFSFAKEVQKEVQWKENA
jgi:hypothetical protein